MTMPPALPVAAEVMRKEKRFIPILIRTVREAQKQSVISEMKVYILTHIPMEQAVPLLPDALVRTATATRPFDNFAR